MTARTSPPPAPPTGTAEPTAALRLSPVRRRVHVPLLAVGVALVVGCALAFGLLAQRIADQRPVLVLSRPVARGTILGEADLAVAQVAADGVRVVGSDRRGRLLGRTLLTSLPAGSLVTPDLVGPGAVDLGPRSRTIGLALDPGGYPTATLAPGDTVSVVGTGGTGTVLDDVATVLAVEPIVEGSATLLVSVVVDADAAAQITSAAAQDQVRLVLHGAGQ